MASIIDVTIRDYFAAHVTPLDADYLEQGEAEALVGKPQPYDSTDLTLTPSQHLANLQWRAEVNAAFRWLEADALMARRGKAPLVPAPPPK